MKVLVTGAGGFVGRYLLKALTNENYTIAALGIGCQSLNSSSVSLYEANILDYDAVLKTMKEFKPDAVIHLAAQSNVAKSWRNPGETTQVNVIGTINVLKAFSLVKKMENL